MLLRFGQGLLEDLLLPAIHEEGGGATECNLFDMGVRGEGAH